MWIEKKIPDDMYKNAKKNFQINFWTTLVSMATAHYSICDSTIDFRFVIIIFLVSNLSLDILYITYYKLILHIKKDYFQASAKFINS